VAHGCACIPCESRGVVSSTGQSLSHSPGVTSAKVASVMYEKVLQQEQHKRLYRSFSRALSPAPDGSRGLLLIYQRRLWSLGFRQYKDGLTTERKCASHTPGAFADSCSLLLPSPCGSHGGVHEEPRAFVLGASRNRTLALLEHISTSRGSRARFPWSWTTIT